MVKPLPFSKTRIAPAVSPIIPLLLCLPACTDSPPPEAQILVDETGFSQIRLPVPLSTYLATERPEVLEAVDFLQVNLDTFGYIADIASSSTGSIAVLDRLEKKVIVFDSAGSETARLGREGRGPGEFLDPWAVAWMGETIIVWQSAQPFLTAFSPTGKVASSPGFVIEGDWQAHPFREPLLRIDYPYQMSDEDITLRLNGIDQNHFGLLMQDNERLTEVEIDNRRSYVTIWGSDLSTVDTLLSLPAAPMKVKQLQGNISATAVDVFAPRSQWTAGDGWYAFHSRLTAEVSVRGLDASPLLTLSWPDTLMELEWSDRENRVNWMEVDRGKKIPKEGKERYASEWLTFSRVVPEVTSLYGMNGCLWISSFSSEDYSNGTGLTLLLLHVDSDRPPRVIRIPRRGARLRTVTPTSVIVTYENEVDVQIPERYRVPGLDCSRQRKTKN